MGTNYYARIIPKEKDKQELKKAIDNNDYNTITRLYNELYNELNEYTHKGGEIHLGKASCGWKFIWNSNIHTYCDGYYDEDNHFIPVYKYWKPYELTKDGIREFIMCEDVEVYDEYGDLENKEEFLEYAFNKEGYDCRTYHLEYPNEIVWRDSEKSLKPFKDLGYSPEYGEFYSDGLRFSTSINFS